MTSELSHKEEFIQKLLIAGCHIGGKKVTKQMEKYTYTQKKDTRIYLFDVVKQYEKICAAARIIAAVPDPSTIIAVSGRVTGQRAVYKFGKYTGAQSCGGRWICAILPILTESRLKRRLITVLTMLFLSMERFGKFLIF